jgi:hypothetical protein
MRPPPWATLERELEVGVGLVLEARQPTRHVRVVHEDVHAAELVGRDLHHALDGLLLEHVRLEEACSAAELVDDLPLHGGARRRVHLRHQDRSPLAGEPASDATADPLPGTRHDRDLVVEATHHHSFRRSRSRLPGGA